jgi:hypothetical protein
LFQVKEKIFSHQQPRTGSSNDLLQAGNLKNEFIPYKRKGVNEEYCPPDTDEVPSFLQKIDRKPAAYKFGIRCHKNFFWVSVKT